MPLPNPDVEPRAYLPGSGTSGAPLRATPAVDINLYLRVLAKRRWVFIVTFLGVLSLAAVYVFTQPSIYRATAKVQVLQPRPVFVLTPGQGQPEEHALSLQTQAKIVQSWLLAEEAATRANSEYNQALSADEVFTSLSTAIEEPDVIAISAENTSSQRAALIANVVQETYIDHSTRVARTAATSAREFLENQVKKLEQDLRSTDIQIKQFRAQNHIPDTDPAAESRARSIVDYSLAADLAQSSVRASQAEIESLRRRLATEAPTRRVNRVASDPLAEGFRQEIATTELELARARVRYDDQHPRVLALKDRLSDLQTQAEQHRASVKATTEEPVEEPNPEYSALTQRIAEEQTQLDSMGARATALAARAAQSRAQLPGVPQTYIGLARLQHAKGASEKAYTAVLEQLHEARLNEASQQGSARKVDIARPPKKPIRPNPAQTLVLAAVLAMLAGISLAYLQETADTGVHDADDLVQSTGISALGFIPGARDTSLISTITVNAPQSPMAESFRLVHANLKFSCVDSPLRTVMVTSAAAAEGKSLVATNLAIVFAQQGMKTLLVDADLRRPQLAQTFACGQSPGVTDVLVGGTPLLEAFRTTDIDNLDILPSGERPHNPSALLDSRRMAALIEEMKGHWEVIVFDTPPALAVADAALLCPRIDATVVVVQQGKVSFRAVAEVRRMILQARGTLVGAVMNRVSPRSGSYYYYHMDNDYGDDASRAHSGSKAESPAALPASTDA